MAVDALPRELQPIVLSVNGLLARLRTALDAEREFTANSAHELRTPIAGALAQTEVLIALLADGPARDRARQVEHALTRLAGLTEKLLNWRAPRPGSARRTGRSTSFRSSTSSSPIFAADGGSGPVEVLRAPDARLFEPADPDAFAIVLRNLVENAVRHGAAEEPITIRIDESGTIASPMAAPPCPRPI